MLHFPVFLDLKGRVALVLGTGEVAERKAAILRQAGAEIRFAPGFTPELLDGCAIAIGADAPEPELSPWPRPAAPGLPVNVVDKPALCTALMRAIIDRDPMTIAISTGGAAPVLARQVRQRIEAVLPMGLGRVAALADRFKSAVRRRLPDLVARRRFLDTALSGPAADLAMAGRDAEADRAFTHALEGADTAPPGIVHLVGAGPGAGADDPAGLRLLGEADVIVHDRLGTEDGARARPPRRPAHLRRQVPRQPLPAAGGDQRRLLVRLARAGKRVVRLKGGDPLIFGRGGEEAEALAAAGIACEVVPGVTAALACAAGAGIPSPTAIAPAPSPSSPVTGATARWMSPAWCGRARRWRSTWASPCCARSATGWWTQGLDPTTPAAVVERGGTTQQRVLRGTLERSPPRRRPGSRAARPCCWWARRWAAAPMPGRRRRWRRNGAKRSARTSRHHTTPPPTIPPPHPRHARA